MPLEQQYPERPFETADAPRQCGLGQVQGLRGTVEVAETTQGQGVGKLLKLEHDALKVTRDELSCIGRIGNPGPL